jgi:hypothetical protein
MPLYELVHLNIPYVVKVKKLRTIVEDHSLEREVLLRGYAAVRKRRNKHLTTIFGVHATAFVLPSKRKGILTRSK